ncbi:MAG: EutN/CcmL family microcompartment protein [Vulcanimicrobiota bacterium]
MTIGKVVGTVVCTQKTPTLEGVKLQLVQPLVATDMSRTGNPLVAIDAIGAGPGEVVLLASGSSARQTEQTLNTPCDAVIMAIVDSVEVEGAQVFRKGEQ